MGMVHTSKASTWKTEGAGWLCKETLSRAGGRGKLLLSVLDSGPDLNVALELAWGARLIEPAPGPPKPPQPSSLRC